MGPDKVHLWTGRHDIGYHYRLDCLFSKDRHAIEVSSSPEADRKAVDTRQEVAATVLDKSPGPSEVSPMWVEESPPQKMSESRRAEASESSGSRRRPASPLPDAAHPKEPEGKRSRQCAWEHMRVHNRVAVAHSDVGQAS